MPSSGRRKPLDLQRSLHSAVYLQKLEDAFLVFSRFALMMIANYTDMRTLARSATKMNKALVQFIQFCYDNNSSIALGTHAILSIQHRFPRLKGQLRMAWDSVASWRLISPSKSRLPLPRIVLNALVTVMFSLGETVPFGPKRLQFWVAGILIWLGFECLLRPVEIYSLLVSDVKVDDFSDLILVRVRNPKNKRAMGNCQFTMIRHESLAHWLRWLMARVPTHVKILEGGRPVLLRIFQQALALLHLSDIGFVLASLRAGGATDHFQTHENLGRLQYAGRWRSAASMEHYIQEAMSAYISLSLSSVSRDCIDQACGAFEALARPPSTPWECLGLRRRSAKSLPR